MNEWNRKLRESRRLIVNLLEKEKFIDLEFFFVILILFGGGIKSIDIVFLVLFDILLLLLGYLVIGFFFMVVWLLLGGLKYLVMLFILEDFFLWVCEWNENFGLVLFFIIVKI